MSALFPAEDPVEPWQDNSGLNQSTLGFRDYLATTVWKVIPPVPAATYCTFSCCIISLKQCL